MEPTVSPAILLCDGFIKEEGTGKFTIVGTFQIYNSAQFPFTIPGFGVLVMLDNLQPGLKELKVTIRVESPDSGHTIASALASITIPQGYDPSGTIDVPFRLPPMAFPQPGIYHVVVLVNNESVGHRRFVVKPLSVSQASS
jgi:hypothetical protein